MKTQTSAAILILICITIQVYSKKNLKSYSKSNKGQTESANTAYVDVICWDGGHYGRGVGTIRDDCGPEKTYDAGLCYSRCPEGWTGIGPLCWSGWSALGR